MWARAAGDGRAPLVEGLPGVGRASETRSGAESADCKPGLSSDPLPGFPSPFSPTDCSPAGSSVYGILQARVLEWGACLPHQDLPNAGTEPVSTTAPELNHYC